MPAHATRDNKSFGISDTTLSEVSASPLLFHMAFLNQGYGFRKEITIQSSQVSGSGSLSNFPVLISVTDTDLRTIANGGSVQNASGFDIIFTDSDGTTILDHEIESYDATTGAYIAWVRVPTVSATVDTDIYMYYGNSTISSDPSSGSTWDANFAAVYHFPTDNSFEDGTSNNNDGTNNGSTDAAGQIGRGRSFDGTNDQITAANSSSLDITGNQITLEAWVNAPVPNTDDSPFLMKAATGNQEAYMLGIDGGATTSNINTRVYNGSSLFRDDSGTLSNNTWTHVVFVYDGSLGSDPRKTLYVNGVSVATHNANGNIASNTASLSIGKRVDARYFDGILDELRISDTPRSADWILTEYNNQNAPGSFISVATAEANPCTTFSGGTATATDSNVESGNSTTITLSGEDAGATGIQWQSSSDNVTFSDIVGQTSSTLNTGAITATTFFRAVVTNATCEANSTTATVNLLSGFIGGYNFRKKITINSSEVCGSSLISDFPVLISLTDADLATTANSGGVENSNGYDIAFTTSDGNTLLDHEIEFYTETTGNYIAWVRIPSLDPLNDTEIFINYGNDEIIADPSVSTVWDASFAAIYHFPENSSFADATSNNNDGTNNGSTDAAGQIGRGRSFDGTDDQITAANSSSLDITGNQITLEAWVNAPIPNTDDSPFIQKATAINQEQYMLGVDGGASSNNINTRVTTGSGLFRDDTGTLPNSTWTHIVFVYDGTLGSNPRKTLYVNGASVATDDADGNLSSTTADLSIGKRADARYFEGDLDELRISSAVRSADWICTEYNNQSSPGTFYTLGTEEVNACADFTGGTASASNSNIDSGTGTTVTVFGYSNDATGIQWQSSTDNVTFSDISGATSAMLSTGNLTETTFFRAVITNSLCSDFSSVATVNINVPFLGGYCYRKSLTINSSQVSGSGSLTDFPVLVSFTDADLATTANGGFVENGSGFDITFTSSDGSTVLDHEIESYTASTGAYRAWVRVPSVSATADTEIYMYFGNNSISTDPSVTTTWDASFVGVWHMDGDPSGSAPQQTDASTNSNNATAAGSQTGADLVAGQIGNAIDFEGTDDEYTAPDDNSLDITGDFSVSAWVNLDNTTGQRGILSKQGSGDNAWGFLLATGALPRMRLGTSFTDIDASTASGISTGTWYHLSGTFDASAGSVNFYLNGAQLGTAVSTSDTPDSNTSTLQIGSEGVDDFIDGRLDEIRLSAVVRDADWIATEYNNQLTPSSFYTVGSRESLLDGGTVSPVSSAITTGSSTTLTLSGHTTESTTVQWQSSTDNVTFADIGGETGTTLNTGVLTQTTYYRAVISGNGCSENSSNAAVNIIPASLAAYGFTKRLFIDPSVVCEGTDLTNFPYLISITNDDLRTTANSGDVESSSGFDILFTASDEVTILNHEIESYDATTGAYLAWVQIPTLSASSTTELVMYYGNSAIASDPSSSSTWDSDYAAIYHFASGKEFNDATVNGNTGTNSGTTDVAGQIGRARNFDGTNDQITAANSTSLNITGNEITLEAWVNATVPNTDDTPFILKPTTGGGSEHYMLGIDGGTTSNNINTRVTTGSGTFRDDTGTLSDATWTHVVMTYDASLGTNPRKLLYVNGSLVSSLNADGTLTSSTEDLSIGKRVDARFYEGILDELRISDVARSSNYICTSHANQSAPTSFLTVCDQTGGNTWTGNVDTDWNNGSNWSNCTVPGLGEDITIADVSAGSNNFPVLDQSRSYGSLTVDNGATITLGANTLTLTGDLTNNGTIVTTSSTVSLEGTATQIISGTTATSFANLTINNTSVTGVNLSQDLTVTSFLNLTDGLVNTSSSDILTVSSTGGTSGGSDASHINGPMQKTGNGDFLFPVGKSGVWAPIEITSVSVSDTFTAEYFHTSPANTTSEGAGLDRVSALEYWSLTRSGSASASVALHWKDDTRSEIGTPADLVVALFNTGSMAWNSIGQSAVSGTTTGFVRAASTSTFGDFTFGSAAGQNALPITLLYFESRATEEGVLLSWATSSEENNAFFTLERATSMTEFEPIKTVPGAGTSSATLTYQFLDKSATPGRQLYRLKQTDFNGKFTYSEIVAVTVTRLQRIFDFSIAPNPNSGSFSLILSGLDDSATQVVIKDIQGKKVFGKTYQLTESRLETFEISIETTGVITKGIYLVMVENGGKRAVKRMIVH
ncbi:MAG: hypothetical protein Roseis2KO_37410 [Roseivirga sp.]